MKITFLIRRVMGGAAWCAALGLAIRLSAADAPAQPAAPAPAPAAPSGSWYVFSPPKEGVVLAPAQREKLLTLTKNFLERDTLEVAAHLKAANNPFYVKLPPPESAASTPGAGASTTAPIPPPVLSDGEKLQQIADQLRPTGALIGGASRLVVFASGDTLGVGLSIMVTFPDETVPAAVFLQNVTSDSYTLKLRDTVKTFPFAAKTSSASRSAPSNTPKPPSRD